MMMKNKRFLFLTFALLLVPAALLAQNAGGVTMPIPKITFNVTEANNPKDVALSLQILFLLSILTLAPSIIIMMTAFTRVVIVLDFVKRALSLQQMPPNQVIVGLSLFLTFFIMAPTFTEINEKALQPYLNGQISNQQFFDRSMEPMREFMFRQTREKDIALFVKLAKIEKPKSKKDIPSYCLIPAFMISELRIAFEIGVLLFLPFIVIDMIIASALMAMGMIMLPPVMISLPFKLILFILVDGWNLLVYELVRSFK
ncbi:MAG TPA: flagellar type III secretion system pore protein FliP [Spirochaetota bacterium]|nr:flagellar type III secretion system pore protein FliP [Spirochaetota bacterium]HOK92436.1 flagellar type III secretion system pore protein FliP [Spirochaetota bacterium]HON15428.1 flagellar type III secretion system pore protein FliP [Spirochaetota bacterium]HOV08586.1 flagellar type III secretion system pore protein FliP [Spirochaetota bacterium]HPD77135.1 flagellar type III secretion system pore protein FliP [Spirochaetota bacterium]